MVQSYLFLNENSNLPRHGYSHKKGRTQAYIQCTECVEKGFKINSELTLLYHLLKGNMYDMLHYINIKWLGQKENIQPDHYDMSEWGQKGEVF